MASLRMEPSTFPLYREACRYKSQESRQELCPGINELFEVLSGGAGNRDDLKGKNWPTSSPVTAKPS
jgi:hypothetical protein